jgi:hypothetical protein
MLTDMVPESPLTIIVELIGRVKVESKYFTKPVEVVVKIIICFPGR